MKLAVLVIAILLAGCGTTDKVTKQMQAEKDRKQREAIGVVYECNKIQGDMASISEKLSVSKDTLRALEEYKFFDSSLYPNLPQIFQINKVIWTVDCNGYSKLGRGIYRWTPAKLDEITVDSLQRQQAERKALLDARNARLKQAGILQ